MKWTWKHVLISGVSPGKFWRAMVKCARGGGNYCRLPLFQKKSYLGKIQISLIWARELENF